MISPSKRTDQGGKLTLSEFQTNEFTLDTTKELISNAIELSPASSIEHIIEVLDQLKLLKRQLDVLKDECSKPSIVAQTEPFSLRMAVVETNLADLQTSIVSLEGRVANISRLASRVGVRMQYADEQAKRAKSAATTLQHIYDFATAEDPSELPSLFHEEATLADAAIAVGKLTPLLKRATEGRTTTTTTTNTTSPGQQQQQSSLAPPPGTLAAAADQLALYTEILDNRIVARFDAALAVQDLEGMAACCRAISAARGSESLLVGRYISTRPIFADPEYVEWLAAGRAIDTSSDGGNNGVGGLAASIEASKTGARNFAGSAFNTPPQSTFPSDGEGPNARAFSTRIDPEIFRWLSSFLREEAVVMEQVFVDPGAAAATLVQRIFEQTVSNLLVTKLTLPDSDAPPEVLRPFLVRLTDAHRRSLALAEEGRSLAGPDVGDPSDLAATACGPALEAYLAMELSYMAGLGGEKVNDTEGVDRELVLDLIAMAEEALRRCVSLSCPEDKPVNVRVLFHSAAPSGAVVPGGLLGMVGNHLVAGLTEVTDASIRKMGYAFRPATMSVGIDVGEPVAAILKSLREAAACVLLLKECFEKSFKPLVSSSTTEEKVCSTGLEELVAVMDAQGAAALRRLLAQCMKKLEWTLGAEQKRADFRPSESGAINLAAPTDACIAGIMIVMEIVKQAQSYLHGSNVESFLAELAVKLAATLKAHMLRYTFNPAGALRWQRDLAEYSSCLLDKLGISTARDHFDELHAQANLLVVGPESLKHLMERMESDINEVKAVIERREDFKTVVDLFVAM